MGTAGWTDLYESDSTKPEKLAMSSLPEMPFPTNPDGPLRLLKFLGIRSVPGTVRDWLDVTNAGYTVAARRRLKDG